MKKFLTTALAALSLSLSVSASTADTVPPFKDDGVFNIIPYEESFAFSSVEWYNRVLVYDIGTGRKVAEVNLRREARRQCSQIVFVPYGGWGCGEYCVVARGGGRTEWCRFVIYPYRTMMVE